MTRSVYLAKHERINFPKPVQRQALERSKGKCECVGARYGLPDGVRCDANLAYGLHFEHVTAASIGGKPTLDNCLAACPKCNLYKANREDKPRAAKTKRQSDKHHGIKAPKAAIKNAPFQKAEKPRERVFAARLKEKGIDGSKFIVKRKTR